MKIRPIYAVYLIVALVLVIVGVKVNDWLTRDFDAWEQEIAAKTDSLRALEQEIEDGENEFREAEEEWKEQRQQDSTMIADLTVDVIEAESDAVRREGELRRRLPIQFRAEYDALLLAHRRQVDAILNREAEKDRIIERQDARHLQTIADFEEINADLHKALRLSKESTQHWKDKAHRSWYEKWQVVAPLTAGVTLAGVVLLATAVPD